MAPQRVQKIQPQPFTAQYGEMIRWQRERLLAGDLLEQIATEQDFIPMENAAGASTHSLEAEDRRLARFEALCKLDQEKQREEHFKYKQERERLIRDIRTLHRLVAQTL